MSLQYHPPPAARHEGEGPACVQTWAGVNGNKGGHLRSSTQVAQWQRIRLQCRRPGFNPWVRKIPWRREKLPAPVYCIVHGVAKSWTQLSDFHFHPGGSVVKNLPANAGHSGDRGSIPGSGRSPGEGNGNPLQYSCLENPMDGGVWRAMRVGHNSTLLLHHASQTPRAQPQDRNTSEQPAEHPLKPLPEVHKGPGGHF